MTQYKQCSKDTMAHWIKETLKVAGINSGIYLGHNLRAASTFSAASERVSLTAIIKSANWTKESTFKKHYKKEIDQFYCDFSGGKEFANSLLTSFK